MNATFYGVLGVGPDAADDEVRAAYRECVKNHHPDVSTDPDAAERFKRITAAKETLLDPKERARYDRLGHAAYVRSHGDSSLWRDADSTGDRRSTADSGSPTANGSTASTARNRASASSGGPSKSTSQSAGRSRWTGSRSEARSSRRGTNSRARERAGRRSRSPSGGGSTSPSNGSSASGASGGSETDRGSNESPGRSEAKSESRAESNGASPSSESGSGSDSPRSNTGTDANGSTTAQSDSTATASGTGADGGEERGSSSSSERTDTGRRRSRMRSDRRAAGSAGGAYATGSFWDAPESEVPRSDLSTPFSDRVVGVVRTLGPWVLVHLVFLSLAVATGWYVYTVVLPPAERSLALLFALIGEVGIAVVLSSLHVLSRVYR